MKLEVKYNILFVLTSLGLFISLIIHIATFINVDLTLVESQTWFLHVGIFVIWLLTINFSIKRLGKEERKESYWKLFINNFPKWMIIICILVMAYTAFNFLYIHHGFRESGLPGEIDGQYVLQKNGEITKTLSKSEYIKNRSYFIRSFSGHWIFFYTVAWFVLFRINRLYKSSI